MYFLYVIVFIFLIFLYKKNKWPLHTTTQKKGALKHPNIFFESNPSSRSLTSLKTPSAIYLSRSTSSSSLPSNFLFSSLVDTAIACGVDLRSLGLSKLGLTDWAIFLAFCSSYANWEISKFSETALYSIILLPIHISTYVFSSQWS